MIILLVEDDTALAMGTTYALESEGMQVIHTTDCAQTRKVCGTDQKIDLVLLDVMLPDGDGFSLCEWLKGEQPDIPVIFLTALEDGMLCMAYSMQMTILPNHFARRN